MRLDAASASVHIFLSRELASVSVSAWRLESA
jgi:hypothetical protein